MYYLPLQQITQKFTLSDNKKKKHEIPQSLSFSGVLFY